MLYHALAQEAHSPVALSERWMKSALAVLHQNQQVSFDHRLCLVIKNEFNFSLNTEKKTSKENTFSPWDSTHVNWSPKHQKITENRVSILPQLDSLVSFHRDFSQFSYSVHNYRNKWGTPSIQRILLNSNLAPEKHSLNSEKNNW